MKALLNAANVIASIAGTVAAETVTGGAGTAISGTTSLYELMRRVSGKAPAITAKIAQNLQAELDRHHLTDDQNLLIIQMIEYAPLLPAEVMAAARNPTRICAMMLAKLKDPAHRTAPTQDAFTRVLTPVLTRLLADTEVSAQLRPAFEDATAETMRFIAEQVETLTAQVQGAFERAAIAEFVVKELARRFVPGSGGDFESARRDLEKALEIYTTQQAIGALPHNHHEAIDTVFDEVNRLNRLAQFDEASAALDAALRVEQEAIKTHQEASNARQAAILDRGVDQDRLRNNPASAAERLVARLLLDNPPDAFNALRVLQDEWYVRGRDQGLAFDATVAIHIAEHTLTHAQTPDQRGAALNDLAIALATLGKREPGTARLDAAVLACTEALKESTRERVPLDWATTQMNLGNALLTLGQREPGTARLDAAVLAYTEALKEHTRDRVPLDWAISLFNLGNVEIVYFDKTANPAHLATARTHALAAREVFVAAQAEYYVQLANEQLTKIADRTP
jgi:tetratricopeptide (TPR) repeat protein